MLGKVLPLIEALHIRIRTIKIKPHHRRVDLILSLDLVVLVLNLLALPQYDKASQELLVEYPINNLLLSMAIKTVAKRSKCPHPATYTKCHRLHDQAQLQSKFQALGMVLTHP